MTNGNFGRIILCIVIEEKKIFYENGNVTIICTCCVPDYSSNISKMVIHVILLITFFTQYVCYLKRKQTTFKLFFQRSRGTLNE